MGCDLFGEKTDEHNNSHSVKSSICHVQSPVEQLQQGLSEGWSFLLFQPELRIVQVADPSLTPVQVVKDQQVMDLGPGLQTGVEPLQQEVHHSAIG